MSQKEPTRLVAQMSWADLAYGPQYMDYDI
jgi:hypothetical protein